MQSSRSKKVNRAWLHDHLNDPYVKLAQRHHYRARAAFKLIGIDEQDHLIRPGMTVVDLGSAPGSWSQVVRRRLAAPNLAEDVRSSAVRVSASGQVDGAIEAAVVHVAGTVNGPIRASKRLVVQSGARLNGDLLCRDLQLEYGALVTGSLKSLDSDEVGLKLVAVGRK